MIASRHIPRLVAIMLCICLAACGFIVYAANSFDTAHIPEYQTRLFGDEIITLDIQVDKSDWQALLDNAQAKEWISGALIINGESFSAVGIRTKGNSSLSQRNDGRYSLQFKFNEYIKGQTYYGLDAFCINNMIGDATYMKDYISFEIMDYIGVDTPLSNYASVTVNGEDYGFFLALERYDEAFLDRVYNTSAGELYNVKISMGNRGDFEDRWQDVENSFPARQQANGNPGANPADMPEFSQGGVPDFSQGRGAGGAGDGRGFGGGGAGGGGAGGGFGGGAGGGSLVYTGDDPGNYSAIFDNVIIGTASDKDKERVITAIKNLNAGTNLETYFDVDGILRYFAAHTVVVNLDSYISNMQQNYYIYERDGKLSILPWDYGLAFGGFQSGNASGVVNFPVDTPVSGVSMEERPLLNVLLETDEYRERYHNYLSRIVEGYFESGLFESSVRNLDAKINAYIKNDSSAFYTHEQYETALTEFIKLGYLRAESVKGQLNGTIPSTSAGQNADGSALVDASSVNISALGSMMGGGMAQGGRNQPGNSQTENSQAESPQTGNPQAENPQAENFQGESREPGNRQGDPQSGEFNMPEGNMAQGGFQRRGGESSFPAGREGTPQENRNAGDDSPGGNIPGGSGMNIPPGRVSQTGADTGYAVTVGISLILLVCAIVFVSRPQKNMI